MEMKKVSIIIPVYNCQEYISDSLESVLSQTYQNIEIVVINDGSTDDTQKIIEEYGDRINYYYQENAGVATARNLGLNKCSGHYIAFLDADDIWLPDKLEKQIDVLRKNPDYGFVYCDNYFVDEKKNIIKNYERKIKLLQGDILLDFFMDFFLITSGIVMRKKCLEKTGYFREILEVGEDFDFFLRLSKNYNAGVIKEKLFFRRVWKHSLSRGDYERSKITDIKTIKFFIKTNPTFFKRHKKKIKNRLAQLYFKLGYEYREDGQFLKAYFCFLDSLKYSFDFKVLRSLAFCLLPQSIQNFLKINLQKIKHHG